MSKILIIPQPHPVIPRAVAESTMANPQILRLRFASRRMTMSRIEALIKQHCPDRVEFTHVSNLANIGTGSSNAKDANSNGEYPFYVRSKEIKRIGTFKFNEKAIIIPGEGGIGDIFHFVSGKYALHH